MLQNADPDVRVDMETFLSKVVPEVRVIWSGLFVMYAMFKPFQHEAGQCGICTFCV